MFPFNDKELEHPVKISIEKIRPILTNDGGDITILGIKNAKVYVQLQGACKSCPSSAKTLKNSIERQLKEDIHPDIEIINIPYGEEKNYQIS